MLSIAKPRNCCNEQFHACIDSDFSLAELLDLPHNNAKELIPIQIESPTKCQDISLEFLLCSLDSEKNCPELGKLPESSSLSQEDYLRSLDELGRSSNGGFSLADVYREDDDSNGLCDILQGDDSISRQKSEPRKITASQSSTDWLVDILSQSPCAEDHKLSSTDFSKPEQTASTDEKNTLHDCSLTPEISDSAFCLSDLYIASKDRNHSESSDSSSDSSENHQASKSPDCVDSGYSSDGENAEQSIDLSLAKSTDVSEKINQDRTVVEQPKASYKKTQTKPSLFFEVICCQMKPEHSSTVKVPTTWTGFLQKMNHWQYFTFDTPSPDDIVKMKHSFTESSA